MDSDDLRPVSRSWPDGAYRAPKAGRLEAGLSLRDVGRAIGVAHETIRQWERGRDPRGYHRQHYLMWLAVYGGLIV